MCRFIPRLCAVLALSVIACSARAQFVTVDGDLSEWDSLPVTITDQTGEIVTTATFFNDISRFGVASDDTYLYVMFELVNNAEGLGDNSRVEYATVYVDTDQNTATGDLGGPAGQQIGADLAWGLAKRTSSSSNFPVSSTAPVFLAESSKPGPGTISNVAVGQDGTATTIAQMIELSVPLADLGLSVGDTIDLLFVTERSGSVPHAFADWGDPDGSSAIVTFTIVPEPGASALMLCGLGAALRRRRRVRRA